MAKEKKIVLEKVPNLICPHCDAEIERVEWRPFGDKDVYLVGCAKCRKVLGATYNPTKF